MSQDYYINFRKDETHETDKNDTLADQKPSIQNFF